MTYIAIDDREHNAELLRAFTNLSREKLFDFSKEHLPIGDIVCGNVCIERKEATDFVGSIMDNRLSEQAKKMVYGGYEHKFVIIEGNPYNTISNISYKSIIGKMTSLCLKYNISIIYTQTPTQTAYASYNIIEKVVNEDRFDGNYVPNTLPEIHTQDILARMIAQIPGVGYEKAEKVSAMYNYNLWEFCNKATPAQISTIDGIGKIMSRKIYETIGKR